MPIDPLPNTATVTVVDEAACDACGHADARHDVISRRYCAATMAAALSRACICGGQ